MKKSISNISRVFNVILLTTGILGFLISLFSQEVLTLISSRPEFIQAYRFVPFAVISLYIIFLGQLFNIKTLFFGNYHKFLFLATTIGIVSEVIACYYLIPLYGLTGAVVSRVIAFSMQTLMFVYYSKKEKEYQELYNYRFLFSCLIFMSLLISIPYFIEFNFSFLMNLFIKTGILAVVTVLIFFFFKKEIKRTLGFITEFVPFLKRYFH